MATTRSLSSAALPSPVQNAARHRLRAVDPDEGWGLPIPNEVEGTGKQVADFLPPGATWLPAPQHTLPSLPGRPPMVGYLVLVPADQQPPFLPVAVPDRAPADT